MKAEWDGSAPELVQANNADLLDAALKEQERFRPMLERIQHGGCEKTMDVIVRATLLMLTGTESLKMLHASREDVTELAGYLYDCWQRKDAH